MFIMFGPYALPKIIKGPNEFAWAYIMLLKNDSRQREDRAYGGKQTKVYVFSP
jgi:hypothetical protein